MTASSTQLSKTESLPSERIPPQDLDAEMSLLGSMMLHRDAIELVLPIIARHESQRFYLPEHQELFKVLVDLYDKNKPIDLVVVKDELLHRNLLSKIGEESYMIDLVQSVGSWVNAEHYARIIRDKGMLRDLIHCAAHIMDEAYSDSDDAQILLDREQSLFKATEQRVTNRARPLGETLSDVYRMIETHGGHHVSGLPTGFIELDDLTCGLQPGELIIVAARPSMGKTALALNMADHLSSNEKVPTAFLSMEMSRQQLAQRILCSRGGIDSHKMRRGMLSEPEIARLGYVCQALEEAPMYIDDTPGMTVLELRAKARRMHVQHKISCLFVDYLQLMHATGNENRQQEIAFISRGLKALARELSMPVVAMSQLNRATEVREGHRPRMSDLRESGAIEQDADVVMLLHREEYYKPEDVSTKGQAELIIAKQRNGPTGTVKLQFSHRLTRFANLSIAGDAYKPQPSEDSEAPF